MAAAVSCLVRWLFILSLLVAGYARGGDGYRCAYGQKCLYEPAPPGSAPNCALPGLTYCLYPDEYPVLVINKLVQLGTYDISTLLSDESRADFSARSWRKPPPKYGPPEYPYAYGPNSLHNVDQISLVDVSLNNYQHDYHEAFAHKTPLHPPTAGSYNNPRTPLYTLSNYTANPSFARTFWAQPSNIHNQVVYDNTQSQDYLRYKTGITVGRPNQIGYSQASAWARQGQAVTTYNPTQWWNGQSNPAPRTDVTIERSISLPSSVLFPQYSYNVTSARGRRRRRQATLDIAKQGRLSGAEALKLALLQTRAEVEEEVQRQKRQSPNVVQLCSAREQYITPRAALNNKGNWRYVVNMPDNTSQLVKAEICTSAECNGICSLPLGYSSRCEQKYIQKRLVALQPNGMNLYTDVFWIPSCCQCTITAN